jgi:uncharacterized protein involved in exopolysaccharide biosynthesis
MNNETPNVDIKILIKEFLRYWYLFVVFIPFFLLLAILYIKLASKSYNIINNLLSPKLNITKIPRLIYRL